MLLRTRLLIIVAHIFTFLSAFLLDVWSLEVQKRTERLPFFTRPVESHQREAQKIILPESLTTGSWAALFSSIFPPTDAVWGSKKRARVPIQPPVCASNMSLAFKRRVKKPLSSSDRAFTNAHRTFRKVVVFFFLFVGLFRWYRESGVSSSASNLCIVFESSFTKCSSDPKMEIREQLPCEREFRIGGRARFRGLHEEFFGRDE